MIITTFDCLSDQWAADTEALGQADVADLLLEIRRLRTMVSLAYQMAGHFHGNGNVRYADGTVSRGPVSDAWTMAGKMLKGTLDDR